MQWALSSQTACTQIHAQATRVLPKQDAGRDNEASNDDCYDDKKPLLRMVLAVLANVVGGAVLLSCMYALPHIIAKILS